MPYDPPPLTVHERIELAERISRNVKRATTYVRNSESYIYTWRHLTRERQPKLGLLTDYWTLVEQLLDTAEAIVEYLPDEMFETVTAASFIDGKSFEFNHAEYLVGERIRNLSQLYDRRAAASRKVARIRKLENVAGRTPEEAAAFVAKAAELRERS